jgi:hypothetical protein
MRKHINRRDIGDVIAWRVHILGIEKFLKVTHQGGWITGYIDNFTSTERENVRYSTWMKSISWRVKNNSIRNAIFLTKITSEVLYFCIDKSNIFDSISQSISLAVTTCGFDELYRIDMRKLFCKKDSDGSCASIEI